MRQPVHRLHPQLLAIVLVGGCVSRTPEPPGSGGAGYSGEGGAAPSQTGGAAGSGTSDSGGSAATSGTGGTTPGSSSGALPENTFVFARASSAEPTPIMHLYAYDFVTRTERLLSKLDDDKGQGTHTNGLAISPDRQWIAFGALRFRATPEEISRRQGSIWAVSPDGAQFRKLTANITPADKTGSCSRDGDCLWGQRCRSGQCSYDGLSITPNSPTWAPDGKRLYFRWVAVWNCVGLTTSICLLSSVASTVDGTLEAVDSGAPCDIRGPAVAGRTGDTLLVPQLDCSGGVKDGLYEWSTQPLTSRRPIFLDGGPGGPSVANIRPAWLPNGAGGVFLVGQGQVRRVFRWLAATGEVKEVYAPPGDDGQPESITVGPNGEIVVELSRPEGSQRKRDLYQLNPDTGATTALTRSGDNATPAW